MMTEELREKAKIAFQREEVVFLHHVVAVAFPALPTLNAARKALRQGRVLVDGVVKKQHDALAPVPGSILLAHLGAVDSILPQVEGLLQAWNSKSERPEARIYLIQSDPVAGWAVVNKPCGMHCKPCGFNTGLVTLEGYLPALVEPPLTGTHCRCPRVCHRLDFRVCGPVLVATAEETMRRLKASFEHRKVKKEYRAIVCGRVGEPGSHWSISAPVEGADATTEIQVLSVVRCPHFDFLSELKLIPVTGRHHQLRQHCALLLGAPIVNEERPLFRAAAEAWQRRTGSALPPYHVRGGGNLFLQAVGITFPGDDDDAVTTTVEVSVSSRFERLLRTSQRAFEEGWRSTRDGRTVQLSVDGKTVGVVWGGRKSCWVKLKIFRRMRPCYWPCFGLHL
ncbi:unnamed protein product [Durusdinium trenchii]